MPIITYVPYLLSCSLDREVFNITPALTLPPMLDCPFVSLFHLEYTSALFQQSVSLGGHPLFQSLVLSIPEQFSGRGFHVV